MSTAIEEEEPDIPDSDDLPEDEEDSEEDESDTEVDQVADDDPHGHPHTAGFPAHHHREDRVVYDYMSVHQAGGPDLFPIDRHDTDSKQAEGLTRDQQDAAHLGPLVAEFANGARSLGWSVQVTPHGGSSAGRILSLHKQDRDISVSVVFDA